MREERASSGVNSCFFYSLVAEILIPPLHKKTEILASLGILYGQRSKTFVACLCRVSKILPLACTTSGVHLFSLHIIFCLSRPAQVGVQPQCAPSCKQWSYTPCWKFLILQPFRSRRITTYARMLTHSTVCLKCRQGALFISYVDVVDCREFALHVVHPTPRNGVIRTHIGKTGRRLRDNLP